MVDPDEFVAKLTAIFREQLDDEKLAIGMETQQSDLGGWDSLAHIRVVMGVEREYGVQLDVEEIESIKSVRGFLDAVNAHGGSDRR
jgi:acyl carrier protein